jgi:hypothetical protein
LVQRETQTASYWQEQFTVSHEDVESLYNLLLESNEPQPIKSLALALVQRRCQQEEMAIRTELQRGSLYQPRESYKVGEQLVFPRFDYAAATVVGERPGSNPRYGNFTVIQVEFEGGDGVMEFAARFPHSHQLNLGEGQSLAEAEGLASPQQLYDLYSSSIDSQLAEALNGHEEFVASRGKWFLKGLLVPIHDGHLNIAEAAIDINEGPLPAEAVLRDLGLPDDIPAQTQEFSLSFALRADGRFSNVGPKGQILWYLSRLEPPQVAETPLQLQIPDLPLDPDLFDSELQRLVREIEDEGTDVALIPSAISDAETVVVTLTYPHRRAGSLPITPKTAPFFPEADEDYARVTFIDKRSGIEMPGWVFTGGKYVLGLDSWYDQNQLPVGAYISLYRTDDPLKVLIDFQAVRLKREWIRVAVPQNRQLSFQLLKQPISCEYDALMVIGVNDWDAIDAMWITLAEKPLFSVVRQIFPELAKLNPQGAVHAKTLYSAVNVVRRCPPGPIFHELSTRACFTPMGHGYWTYDPSVEE